MLGQTLVSFYGLTGSALCQNAAWCLTIRVSLAQAVSHFRTRCRSLLAAKNGNQLFPSWPRNLQFAPDLPGIGDSDIPADGLDTKTFRHPHPRTRQVTWRRKSSCGEARHRINGGVRLRGAVFLGNREARGDGRFSAGRGKWRDVYNNPGIWHFRFNGPTPEALVTDASVSTSNTSGTTSPPIGPIQSRKLTAQLPWQPMRVPTACVPGGRISFQQFPIPRTC
jgi:hypothetical protein